MKEGIFNSFTEPFIQTKQKTKKKHLERQDLRSGGMDIYGMTKVRLMYTLKTIC